MDNTFSVYRIRTTGQNIILEWRAKDAKTARREAEECGHKIKYVEFVREVRTQLWDLLMS